MSIFACFRSKETGRDDFIFYSRRLMRLLIEDVMSMLPFKNVTIDTPQGFQYDGKRLDVKQVSELGLTAMFPWSDRSGDQYSRLESRIGWSRECLVAVLSAILFRGRDNRTTLPIYPGIEIYTVC